MVAWYNFNYTMYMCCTYWIETVGVAQLSIHPSDTNCVQAVSPILEMLYVGCLYCNLYSVS